MYGHWIGSSLLLLACAAAWAAGGRAPRPLPVPAKLADVLEVPAPAEVQLNGYLGDRVAKSEKNRLLAVNEDALLAGFRKRPGEQAWIGEHVGKWLHAATLAWANTGDPALREKLDRMVAELLKTQEADGYLGTYVPEKRFGLYPNADWDVWVHKYNLIGLLTYHQYTGSPAALEASRKIGDLLIRTFGPGKKSILSAGTHVGMAATSVLEPMVYLYRSTGDNRFLEFAKYLVDAWDEAGGPRVRSTLLAEKSVQKTANGKAYEMLSNLVGLCELARATGDRAYLQPALNAWEDVVANQLYLTGSASHHEHFHTPHELPNGMSANVGETCVTVTWIQLNSQLLRLTGEAKYADELERSYYNHLAAAQRPDGAQWCYYTSLEGTKPYGPGINCCVSSGPRGIALTPQLTYLTARDGGKETLYVNLFEASTLTTELGGKPVTVTQKTEFPRASRFGGGYTGRTQLTFHMEKPATFGVRLRAPAWAGALSMKASRDDTTVGVQIPTGQDARWLSYPRFERAREWRDGDTLEYEFEMPVKLRIGDHTNAGRAALTYGPLVLAYDDQRNPGRVPSRVAGLTEESAKELTSRNQPGETLVFEAPVRDAEEHAGKATLVPFAEAGSGGGRYQVWLRAPGVALPKNSSLFAFGNESRSREGNVAGSIADGDPETFVVTFNAERREEDWFALQREQPVTIRRVVYAHGKSFHDGGWFDAGAGKPRIEVQQVKGGPWVPVGTLDDYPATTATASRGLKEGQSFTLRLKEPVSAVAVRVIGKPACGDNPAQAFSSCAELQAFGE